eukprot:GDKH01002080.1.p1 GENE.GDKH01002080.1~~GDKH01002080.1.p1  ORF type:complete len:365 (-),score=153.32 GDKH01002080.1:13-1107(-)
MQTPPFQWLYTPARPFTWGFIARVVVKAAILFAALNVAFALARPLPALGRLSAYNALLPGRERLPYGENPAESYNLSLYNIPAMLASHTWAAADEDDFRVLLVGDSSVWGILLEPGDTLAGQINRLGLLVEGRPVRAYNLGYPTMSLLKDLTLLDAALREEPPDLIIWLLTLESFARRDQLDPALLQNNPDAVRSLIARYDLAQDAGDPRFVAPDFWDETIVGRRRDLADLLRLQLYGAAWALTGVDQAYGDYTPRAIDLSDDETWRGYGPGDLARDDLAFDILRAGVARAGEVPVVLVNEPIFLSQGTNRDVRYNAFYPRWAYDAYRAWLADEAGGARRAAPRPGGGAPQKLFSRKPPPNFIF